MTTLNEARLKEAKRQATRLLNRLTDLGVTIKRAQALEGIAAIHNHPDWNHYSAALNQPQMPDSISSFFTESSVEQQSDLIKQATYRFIYKKDYDFTLLAMRPGTGKSTILFHCIADALHRKATAIFIDCAAGGSAKEIPKEILDKATIIPIHVNREGQIIKFDVPSVLNDMVILNVSFFANYMHEEYRREHEDTVNQLGFGNLLLDIQDKLPEEFISRLGYMLVDEFQKVGLGSDNIARTLSAFLRRRVNSSRNDDEKAKVVFACQDFMNIDGFIGLPLSIITDLNTAQDLTHVSKKVWGSYASSQFFIVDSDEFYVPEALDLNDRNHFMRNISKFVACNLHDHRFSSANQKTQFVINTQYEYFKAFSQTVAEVSPHFKMKHGR